MKKLYYSYELFKTDAQKLSEKCKSFEPDIILAVARGGLTLGHFMSMSLNMRNLYTLNSVHYEGDIKLDTFNVYNIPDLSHAKKVLIVDDIVDSGETMEYIFKILNEKFPYVEFKLATLFYKSNALVKPDYSINEANEWIDFFWEVDIS